MNYDEFEKMNEVGNTHWWYQARKKLLVHGLGKLPSGENYLKILDLATACGGNFSVCAPYGKTIGIDISLHSIKICMEKNIKPILQGDVQSLPFKTNSFDIVVALDIFEHVEDDINSMKEIARVLKQNGKLIFNVPAFMFLFSNHDVSFHHLKRYRAGELKHKLEISGLHTCFITYWSFFIFPLVFIVRKFLTSRRTNEQIRSDFFLKLPLFANKVLHFLNAIEVYLIKLNFSLPFGVSLYGISIKQ